MFLALSKLLDWLLEPLTWAVLACVAGTILSRRARLFAPALAIGGALVMCLFSIEPVANRLERLAERSARSSYRPDVVYDTIIVMGGMVDEPASRASGEMELRAEADRLVRAYDLLRAGRARSVIISAGLLSPEPGDVPEADRVAKKLVEWGIPQDRIVAERSSRNTRENAIESSRIAAERGWKSVLVVTSAAHAPRAMGCFRALGLVPDLLPVDHRAGDGRGQEWLPRARALGRSTDALRELAGRAVYRIVGYSR